MSANITVVRGDITVANTDAIVNAANEVMLGGSGVDGAIHRAAGPALLEACRAVPEVDGVRCPVGEARITTAGNLAARYVIHTVGPQYEFDPDPPALLARAYRSSLALAKTNECRSVAFPAISCGVYGYPHDEAAAIAIATCREPEWSELDIVFYLFSDDMVATWNAAL